MVKTQRLLVVDDEDTMLEGCRRIFSRQGFQVEKTNDARRGLDLAEANDYDAILLDIMMPNMTGLEFLENLRARKRNTPVIFMTGYPTVPNAVYAIRLGAVGFVIKPFTPEEITQAVQKQLPREVKVGGEDIVRPIPWVPAAEGFNFWNESWFQRGEDGSVRTGVIVDRSLGSNLQAVRLPRIGEAVFQELPLAELKIEGQPSILIPSPISGVVVALNEALETNPALLGKDPCGLGWIALISPTRLEEETRKCAPRRVILLNRHDEIARKQQEKLTTLGCQVRLAGCWEDLASPLQDSGFPLMLVDAESLGDEGPDLVGRIKAAAPNMKVVLVASPSCKQEAAYRAHRLFYYAVEPFADNEIVDILDAAFRLTAQTTSKPAHQRVQPGAIAGIQVNDGNRTKVHLVAEPGLLRMEKGLGLDIRQKLLDRLLPIKTILGNSSIASTELAKAASTCDRLVVLLAKDLGRLPGTLVRDTNWKFIQVAGEGPGNVTTLVIQPTTPQGDLTGLSESTLAALAEHIVTDLASY